MPATPAPAATNDSEEAGASVYVRQGSGRAGSDRRDERAGDDAEDVRDRVLEVGEWDTARPLVEAVSRRV